MFNALEIQILELMLSHNSPEKLQLYEIYLAQSDMGTNTGSDPAGRTAEVVSHGFYLLQQER